jgi:hypothetical protein
MYKVGQVVYVIMEENHSVIPIKVVEEVSIKNLEGETTKYKGLLPNKKNQKISISKLKNVYTSLSEVKKVMIENANKAITSVVKEAEEFENVFFPKEEKLEENIECNNNSNNIKIDLGNGQVANIDAKSLNNLELDQKKT